MLMVSYQDKHHPDEEEKSAEQAKETADDDGMPAEPEEPA